MPGRGSLFWKLALLLSLSAVITVGLSWTLTRHVGNRVLLLDDEARTVMRGYAAEAWRAWDGGGEAGAAKLLQEIARRRGAASRPLRSRVRRP